MTDPVKAKLVFWRNVNKYKKIVSKKMTDQETGQ